MPILKQINRGVRIDDSHQRVYQAVDLFANGIVEAFRIQDVKVEARVLEHRTFVGSSKRYGMLAGDSARFRFVHFFAHRRYL
jgi:hypothetical protein